MVIDLLAMRAGDRVGRKLAEVLYGEVYAHAGGGHSPDAVIPRELVIKLYAVWAGDVVGRCLAKVLRQ